jgi:hypothetical protein
VSHACERLVHADMPRTGTVYTSKVILRKGRLPRAVLRLQDGSARHLPAWWLRLNGWGASRAIVATVRDPDTWYPSWYAWCVRNCPKELARIGRGSIAWDAVLDGALTPHEGWGDFPLLIGASPSDHGATWSPAAADGGIWSWATRYYTQNALGSWEADLLIGGDLREALAGLGLVDDLPPKHVTRPDDLPTLTASQRARIAEVEGPLWAQAQDKMSNRRAA